MAEFLFLFPCGAFLSIQVTLTQRYHARRRPLVLFSLPLNEWAHSQRFLPLFRYTKHPGNADRDGTNIALLGQTATQHWK